MKNVNDTLLQRRSIRRYERQSVTDSQMDFIYQAIRNTPTSYNGQQFSVIDITDQKVKERLYELTGQKQIKTCSHFMAFCADFNKIILAARAKGVEMPPFFNTADGMIVATVDASLAMMSAVVAAESLGLGTCCIGYARTAAPKEISRELRLPQQVYLVCGLAIGVPREQPDLKPKQPVGTVIHHDRYSRDEDLIDELLDYDKEITEYNATRSGTKSSNDWVSHIVSYYVEAMKYRMRDALRHRGFDPRQ
ncbi:MAG: nitroreductase family protein [Muribaculaceae bacterium]|nr:nitroreductase family protein [Muribaculaceae bacterium]